MRKSKYNSSWLFIVCLLQVFLLFQLSKQQVLSKQNQYFTYNTDYLKQLVTFEENGEITAVEFFGCTSDSHVKLQILNDDSIILYSENIALQNEGSCLQFPNLLQLSEPFIAQIHVEYSIIIEGQFEQRGYFSNSNEIIKLNTTSTRMIRGVGCPCNDGYCDTQCENCNSCPPDCQCPFGNCIPNENGFVCQTPCTDFCTTPVPSVKSSYCLNGFCAILECDLGLRDCDRYWGNGCESATFCNILCTDQCQTLPMVLAGACDPNTGNCRFTCQPDFGDCDLNPSNGCETPLLNNPNHCGGCNHTCGSASIDTGSCTNGVCDYVCLPGTENCDNDSQNGCEVNIKDDVAHCGDCFTNCQLLDNTTNQFCKSGVCEYDCNMDRGDCDGGKANGCETDLIGNSVHCGSCNNDCTAIPHTIEQYCQGIVCGYTCQSGWDDCTSENGCETDITSVNSCGGCSNDCTILNNTQSHQCIQGKCSFTCLPDYANCDSDTSNGCETYTATSIHHCGTCGNDCVSQTTAQDPICVNGVCTLVCPPGFDSCDFDFGNGCETQIDTVNNCGECGRNCSTFINTQSQTCDNGECAFECVWPYGNCNITDGCETDLANDSENCGTCKNDCLSLNYTLNQFCDSSVCFFDCVTDRANCDGDASNGCEVNITSNVNHCSSCLFDCQEFPFTQAQTCVQGSCGFECVADHLDCDFIPTNGCEVNIKTNTSHCGECNNDCNILPHTENQSCSNGKCSFDCISGWGDCDNDFGTGCETDLTSDEFNCGSCSKDCNKLGNVIDGSCNAMECSIDLCEANYANCNLLVEDGCEIDLTLNISHCGACVINCTSLTHTHNQDCQDSQCIFTCDTGFDSCDGDTLTGCETNLSNDTLNCGWCDFQCTDLSNSVGGYCELGECKFGCAEEFGNCDDQSTNGCESFLVTDVNNCGSCGFDCQNLPNTDEELCNNSKCEFVCTAPFDNCDGDPNTGCEVNLQNTTQHCGSCGKDCGNTNAVAFSCNLGFCNIDLCPTNFGDCNTDAGDGCEAYLPGDVNNCNECNLSCYTENVDLASCNSGVCAIEQCAVGFANCDEITNNGCEINVSSLQHCQSCENDCTILNNIVSPSCTPSGCEFGCVSGFSNCNLDPSDGCEININNDLYHCGNCGVECVSDLTATSICIDGGCVLDCNDYYLNCDGQDWNGCEENGLTSVNFCGNCETNCALLNNTVSQECTGGICSFQCMPGFYDCDEIKENGCESDNSAFPNCGECGRLCIGFPQTVEVGCSNSECVILSCTDNYQDCDDDPINGCESNMQYDVTNCGGCMHQCVPQFHAVTVTCSGGQCAIISCDNGFKDCNGIFEDGCEVDINSDEFHCGDCYFDCNSLSNIQNPSCIGGQCSFNCTGSWSDCDGDSLNGCETDTDIDALNCGDCKVNCNDLPQVTGSPTCSAGSCVIQCVNGYSDCDGDTSNGCEVDLNSSVEHCGGCLQDCNSVTHVAELECLLGSCSFSSCSPGYGNCDVYDLNGCETNLLSDSRHCGDCITDCTAEGTISAVCSSGGCVLTNCTVGFEDCDLLSFNGCEVDITLDPENCGTCGNNCFNIPHSIDQSCISGDCEFACDVGYLDCSAGIIGCETPVNSLTHCGSCENDCTSLSHVHTVNCIQGACNIQSCEPGWGNCDNIDNNGCETDLSINYDHCNECGLSCYSFPNIDSASCNNGECVIELCKSGFGNCDLDPSTGCEINLSSVDNCLTCGNNCTLLDNTVSQVCTPGGCLFDCIPGFGDCNEDPSDGCEANIDIDGENCGSCGTQCASFSSANGECVSGLCVLNCFDYLLDCDGDYQNGCEENGLTSVYHCGDCSINCSALSNTNSQVCESGICSFLCQEGFSDCDYNVDTGCETDLNDASNCGECGNECLALFEVSVVSCSNYTCMILECLQPYADCDTDPNTGCEIEYWSDIMNCGSCGQDCASVVHVDQKVCLNGTCSFSGCSPGFGNCDGNDFNGCEKNFQNDAKHCGNCTNDCTANGTISAVCTSGSCVLTNCTVGSEDCDLLSFNGCETNITNDFGNCGGCGNNCSSVPNSINQTCISGVCNYSCVPQYLDCVPEILGCETSYNTINHCGSCDFSCLSLPNVQFSQCSAGVCSIQGCHTPWGDCDGNTTNGCETDLGTNSNCGQCGISCLDSLFQATQSCVDGACQIISCSDSFGDCDGNITNGCETQLNDTNNCGSCGTNCNGLPFTIEQHCDGGCKFTCNAGIFDCDGIVMNGCESNSLSDVNNCGGCNNDCTALQNTNNQQCLSGVCAFSCAFPYIDCDNNTSNGCEVYPTQSLDNCSVCGNYCPNNTISTEYVCIGNYCQANCVPPYVDCDGEISNGCETDLTSDSYNCGFCGTNCLQLSNTASASCEFGTCRVNTCVYPYSDCNSQSVDGCESDTRSDTAHCGSCGNFCATYPNTSMTCTDGMCGWECYPGWYDCNSNSIDGCEATFDSSRTCGSCYQNCETLGNVNSTYCVDGTCVISICAPGYGDCDEQVGNGCELYILNSVDNCGSCNFSCNSLPGVSSSYCSGDSCVIMSCNIGASDCDGVSSNGCETNIYSSNSDCGGCHMPCGSYREMWNCTMGMCQFVGCNYGFANCDSMQDCEVDLLSDYNNCGYCGHSCYAPGSSSYCSNGICIYNCGEGYGDCDGQAGCEVIFSSDNNNCGSCWNNCSNLPNVDYGYCNQGNCSLYCKPGYGDCNYYSYDGCEQNLVMDNYNCGGCNVSCYTLQNVGSASCELSGCVIYTCAPGYYDCDRQSWNGCESSSICSCDYGYANCDSNNENGCETNVLGDAYNCGGCNYSCYYENVNSAECYMGQCQILECNFNYANCDGNVYNGCEADLNYDIFNCGGCDIQCINPPGSEVTCLVGACVLISCDYPFENCNGAFGDGCEADLTSITSCGYCGHSCEYLLEGQNILDLTCSGTDCGIVCLRGYADCDEDLNNGCESDLSDISNCGECGNVCNNGLCVDGICTPFPSSSASYSASPSASISPSQSVSPTRSSTRSTSPSPSASSSSTPAPSQSMTRTPAASISATSSIIPSPSAIPSVSASPSMKCTINLCGNGICDVGCGETSVNCCSDCNAVCGDGVCNCKETASNCCGDCGECGDGECSSPCEDETNCCDCYVAEIMCGDGVCFSLCESPLTCFNDCKLQCDTGFQDCNDQVGDGCETNVVSDVTHCGGCFNDCNTRNNVVAANCENGTCEIVNCSLFYADCNNIPDDGCELKITDDPNNCGACGTRCIFPHAQSRCTTGSCEIVQCDENYFDADNQISTGCELFNNSVPEDNNNNNNNNNTPNNLGITSSSTATPSASQLASSSPIPLPSLALPINEVPGNNPNSNTACVTCNLQPQPVRVTISSTPSSSGDNGGGSSSTSNSNSNSGISIPIASTVDSVSLGSISIADTSSYEGYQITVSGGTSDASTSAANIAATNNDGSSIVSTIFSIQLFDANGIPVHDLPSPLEICFNVPDSYVGSSCLSYFDTITSSWLCQGDTYLSGSGEVCGLTDHLTNFAVLLTGNTGKNKTNDNGVDSVTGWLSLSFGIAAIAIVVLSVAANELRRYKKARDTESEFRKLTSLISETSQLQV